MSEHVRTQLQFVMEHELILAGKALRRWRELHGGNATHEEKTQALADAVNACNAALYHIDGSVPLILTSAKVLFGFEPVTADDMPDHKLTSEEEPRKAT